MSESDKLIVENAETDGRTRWKYAVIETDELELATQLETYGMFGWEVASITVHTKNPYPREQYIVVFKMPYWLTQPNQENNE